MGSDVKYKIQQRLYESERVMRETAEECWADVERGARLMAGAIETGRKIMYCGNGGSAADSQHLAAEFTNRLRSELDRRPLAALALTTDTSFLTANGNDYGFEHIFERQIEALGLKGDVLIGISTSGESQNVLRAVAKAGELGIKTVGYLGAAGGVLAEAVDIPIVIPSGVTQHIQEAHIAIGHIMVELVELQLFGR